MSRIEEKAHQSRRFGKRFSTMIQQKMFVLFALALILVPFGQSAGVAQAENTEGDPTVNGDGPIVEPIEDEKKILIDEETITFKPNDFLKIVLNDDGEDKVLAGLKIPDFDETNEALSLADLIRVLSVDGVEVPDELEQAGVVLDFQFLRSNEE